MTVAASAKARVAATGVPTRFMSTFCALFSPPWSRRDAVCEQHRGPRRKCGANREKCPFRHSRPRLEPVQPCRFFRRARMSKNSRLGHERLGESSTRSASIGLLRSSSSAEARTLDPRRPRRSRLLTGVSGASRDSSDAAWPRPRRSLCDVGSSSRTNVGRCANGSGQWSHVPHWPVPSGAPSSAIACTA